jgi:hypothetical protein
MRYLKRIPLKIFPLLANEVAVGIQNIIVMCSEDRLLSSSWFSGTYRRLDPARSLG